MIKTLALLLAIAAFCAAPLHAGLVGIGTVIIKRAEVLTPVVEAGDDEANTQAAIAALNSAVEDLSNQGANVVSVDAVELESGNYMLLIDYVEEE
ncbi:MAG: hypothetical protein SF028_15455 [Candidatus Sumerlaeia bacterium]|nr:hypothetical protein [Candidatus Sumerlaeia bacterium]